MYFPEIFFLSPVSVETRRSNDENISGDVEVIRKTRQERDRLKKRLVCEELNEYKLQRKRALIAH